MSLLTLLLLALPAAGALLASALPRVAGVRVAVATGLLTLVVAAGVVVAFDYSTPSRLQLVVDQPWLPGLGSRFHLGVDGISLPLVVLAALLVALVLVAIARNAPAPGRQRALAVLVLVLEIGMEGTFLASDLLLFFVFFEVVLIPMYAVIALWGGPGRRAAATKFALYTLLGSAVMLVGLLLVGAYAGTYDLQAIALQHGAGMSRSVQIVGFLLVAGGLAVKVPLWPLHGWLPDAHSEAPTAGSVLLAGVLLKMAVYGIVRIAVPGVPEGAHAVAPFLGAYAVVGILYASLACLGQRDLKRLVAYSSVGHMGFVLLGVSTLSPVGINAALFGNVAHGVITGLLFFVVGGIRDRYGTTDLTVLGAGMRTAAPTVAGFLAVASVASLGVPGFAGFWGEILALLGAWEPAPDLPRAAYLVYLGLAGLGSVLTAAYFLVMLHRVANGEPAERWRRVAFRRLTATEFLTWTPLAVLMVAGGLWPRALLGLTTEAVRQLLGVR